MKIIEKNTQEMKKFKKLLSGAEGCNFFKAKNNKIVSITCKHNLFFSEKILKKYFKEYNAKETLKYFRNNGGFCDCEVLFNL